MENTPNLDLPYLMPSQAQKHVTHNEALQRLDATVQLSVLDRGLAVPPSTPAEGARYLVAPGASGAWTGQSGRIAAFMDGDWWFFAPKPGWRCWIEDEGQLAVWDGAAWAPLAGEGASLSHAPEAGVNTVGDATNRLAVKSNAVLFSHDDITPGTGDIRHKLNKSAAATTASLVFQTNFSGRAELGLAGDDNWRLKVSPDGANWKDAITVDRGSGAVGIGVSPARQFHVQGSNALWRLDRDANIVGLQLHRFPTGDFSAPWKGFLVGVEASASNNGAFTIGDYGTATSGSAVERLRIDNAGAVLPGADNGQSLGSSTKRWSVVYAATGTISTSDARDKTVIGRLGMAASSIDDAVEPVLFKWDATNLRSIVDDSVQYPVEMAECLASTESSVPMRQTAPGRRQHIGWIAQDVKAAFDAAGLDCAAWGLDDPANVESRQWLRPDQLTALLWEALRQTRAEVLQLRRACSG